MFTCEACHWWSLNSRTFSLSKCGDLSSQCLKEKVTIEGWVGSFSPGHVPQLRVGGHHYRSSLHSSLSTLIQSIKYLNTCAYELDSTPSLGICLFHLHHPSHRFLQTSCWIFSTIPLCLSQGSLQGVMVRMPSHYSTQYSYALFMASSVLSSNCFLQLMGCPLLSFTTASS